MPVSPTGAVTSVHSNELYFAATKPPGQLGRTAQRAWARNGISSRVDWGFNATQSTTSEAQTFSRITPYPAIGRHGLIGDRRTAALVAADGTLDWLCLPDYDGPIIFGALLDWFQGGHWRLGPVARVTGQQAYLRDNAVLETRWTSSEGTLVLRDAMLWPETDRAPEQQPVRALVRWLSCTEGRVQCRFGMQLGYNFSAPTAAFSEYSSGFSLNLPELAVRVWSSQPLQARQSQLRAEFELEAGQGIWTVLDVGATGHGWSPEAARAALDQTEQSWQHWLRQFQFDAGASGEAVRRAALIVHLLGYAPAGCVVAAPTTSLPERLGGSWNADYRFAWVRDSSLALGMFSRLGDWQETERYLQWLVARQSRFGHPLQVLYSIHGERRPRQSQLKQPSGYRQSRPVRVGNHAYKQQQLGSLGFLADCAWLYLKEGGRWEDSYWRLIRRCADYVSKHWVQPDNGVWELSTPQQFVHSKVLCWVMLDRAIKIAQKVADSYDVSAWQAEREKIHNEVMDKGWCESLGAFRQYYGADNLDAAELLIPLMEFLPADHPRVVATVERIAEALSIDGLVYRFDPLRTPGAENLPLGEMEGAFLPCTFWLATAFAKMGRLEQAAAILARVEQMCGPLGLFSEGADPRTNTLLGNTPLLFSHSEYVRARLELAQAQRKSEPLRQVA